nr:hypothetical protein [Tanacetum cinerariifolium]
MMITHHACLIINSILETPYGTCLSVVSERTGSNNTTIHDPIITQENLPWMKRGSGHKRRKKIRKKEREKKQRLLFLVVAQEHRTCSSYLKKDLETPKRQGICQEKDGDKAAS